jgi:hypothetical protein
MHFSILQNLVHRLVHRVEYHTDVVVFYRARGEEQKQRSRPCHAGEEENHSEMQDLSAR